MPAPKDNGVASTPPPWKRWARRALWPGLAGAVVFGVWCPTPGQAVSETAPRRESPRPADGLVLPTTPTFGSTPTPRPPVVQFSPTAPTVSGTPAPGAPSRRALDLAQLKRMEEELAKRNSDYRRLRQGLDANRASLENVYDEMRDLEERRRELDQRQADLAMRSVLTVPSVINLPVSTTGLAPATDGLVKRRDELRVELARLRTSRTDLHPQVKAVAGELAAVEAILAEQAAATAAPASSSSATPPAPSVAAPASGLAAETASAWLRRAEEATKEWNAKLEQRQTLLGVRRQLNKDIEYIEERCKQLGADIARLSAALRETSDPLAAAAVATLVPPGPALPDPDDPALPEPSATVAAQPDAPTSPAATDSRRDGLETFRYRNLVMLRTLMALLGFVLGGLLGIGFGWLRLRFGNLSRHADEAAAQCGLPLLGSIPPYDHEARRGKSSEGGQWLPKGDGVVFIPSPVDRHEAPPIADRPMRAEQPSGWGDWLGTIVLSIVLAGILLLALYLTGVLQRNGADAERPAVTAAGRPVPGPLDPGGLLEGFEREAGHAPSTQPAGTRDVPGGRPIPEERQPEEKQPARYAQASTISFADLLP